MPCGIRPSNVRVCHFTTRAIFRRGGVNITRPNGRKCVFEFDTTFFRNTLSGMLSHFAFFFTMAASGIAGVAIPATSRQVVLVTSPGWESSKATVRILSRTKQGWVQDGAAMTALTGRNGMAWGLGLHRMNAASPQKVEGDGRAPAGVFDFGSAFSQTPMQLGVPCVTIEPSHEGVDDPDSRYYNRLVDRRTVAKPDWKTSEKLHGMPHYGLGIWVAHNPQRKRGAGSCIYLHEWVGERDGTAGCTVLRHEDLLTVMTALKSDRHPVLVQFPESAAQEHVPVLIRACR